MKKTVYFSLLLFSAATFNFASAAQEISNVRKTAIKSAGSKGLSKVRRDDAISLLMSLATEAQDFNPQLRAYVQANAANLLWKVDKTFARALYLKAWDAAEKADQDSVSKLPPGQGNPTINPRDARREIVFLAMQNDSAFGMQLLDRMSNQESLNNEARRVDQPQNNALSSSDLDRLTTARRLLENGDLIQARELAGEAVNITVIPTLRFLSELRKKDPRTADELYVRLVARAEVDPWADANMVSLLSSYIFSPGFYFRISNNGFPIIVQSTPVIQRIEVPYNIRAAFLQTAAIILIRPVTDPISLRSVFMIGTRLLPVFDEFDPGLANQIRSRLIQISPSISPALKTREITNKVQMGMGSEHNDLNTIDELLRKAEELTNPNARDSLFIRAAIQAAGSGDSKAEDIIEKITDDELKKQGLPYIRMSLAKYALEHKQVNEALRLARLPELTGIQRVWIYLQIVKSTRSQDAVMNLLFEALPIARAMQDSSDKVYALSGIASQFIKSNSAVGNQNIAEALNLVDKLDTFELEDTSFNVRIESSVGDWSSNYSEPGFSFANLFLELEKRDFFKAIYFANSLHRKELKSAAILTIARSAMNNGRFERSGS